MNLDHHPCGPTLPLCHSWLDGECQDCGAIHEEHDVDDDGGTCSCGVYVEALEPEEYERDPDEYRDERWAWEPDTIAEARGDA